MRIEFFYDFASTYSYVAAMTVESVAEAAGVEVEWRPFLLGPIFSEQGYDDSPFKKYPPKWRYMWRDIERTCEFHSIPFKRPSEFPRRSTYAGKLAILGDKEGWIVPFSKRVFQANFVEDRDIGEIGVMRRILEELGLPLDAVDRIDERSERVRLRHQTERARELGIFGAPTFVVGQEIYWGHDRLEQAIAQATRAGSSGGGAPSDGGPVTLDSILSDS